MGLLLFYAFVSIFFSFLCSILEAVLLSVTPTFVSLKKQEGRAYAVKLEMLKKDVDRPLIAILTLNTVAHTVGAILVGVQAKVAYLELYGSAQRKIFGFHFSEDMMVGVVSALMTLLILIASEIIPKTLGAIYWKKLARFTTRTLNVMIWALKWTGILWLLQVFTKLIGKKAGDVNIMSREDFTTMTDIALEEGVFQESESTIIQNLIKFDQVQVQNIMTPRTVMKIASEKLTLKEFSESNPKMRFSRIPVFKDKEDDVTGFVLKDEILESIIQENGGTTLSSIKRPILFVDRTMAIPELFELLLAQKNHIAMVVDEYGTISGLVTMEDVIETLLGLEIVDESDATENLQLLARRNWQSRAERLGIIDKDGVK